VLRIDARLIRLRRARVVDREVVVAVVDLHVQQRQVDCQALRRLQAPAPAHRQLVEAGGVAAPQVGVRVVAVAREALHGEAVLRVERRCRAAEHRADAARVVVADTALDTALELRRRRGAGDVDEATQCIRAVASALRATQHLDAVDVEQGRHGAEAAEVDVVDQKAD